MISCDIEDSRVEVEMGQALSKPAAHHLTVVESAVKSLPTVMQVCATLGYGGSERVALQSAIALQAAGGKSIVAGSSGGLVDEIVGHHIKFAPVPTEGYNPFSMIANIRRFQKIIEREKVDVVHIHNRAPGWSAYLAARRMGVPVVATYHSAYSMSAPFKRFFNSIMARTDRVIISSNYIGGYIDAHHGRDPSHRILIRNGIDLEKFNPASVSAERVENLRKAWGIDANTPTFIMPARLTRLKGHCAVIEAAAKLVAAGVKDFVCLFVGGDERRDSFRHEMENEMAKLGVRDHIRITGPTHDMPAAFALSDFAISASTTSENLSLAVIEASAMGLPVITTKLGASGEVILAPPSVTAEERTGWFVQPGDVDELAIAMAEALKLTKLEKERLSQKARSRIEAEFDAKAGLARTVELYAALSLVKKQGQ